MTEEKKTKLDELNQKKAELEKALTEETNGQKKGGITRSLNAVVKEIEALESADDSSTAGSENGKNGSDQGNGPAAGSGSDPDPDVPSSDGGQGKGSKGGKPPKEEKKIPVSVRSKTGQKYRRLGMVFNKNAKPEKVTAEQLEALKKDPWLEVKEVE